jgi:hypothetical protein
MDKRLPPTPTPLWKKALPVVVAVGAAVFYWYYSKK